ncbi:MAG: DMT family transporter [Pseudomonadota bacterium]
MLYPVAIMFLAMSLIPAGDSAGKLLTSTLSVAPLFVAWSRFALGAVLLVPFCNRSALRLFQNWRVWLRASTLAAGISCIQVALQTTDIATVFSAFFVGPLISYVLAMVFLKERVTTARSAMIVIGFVGVLVVIRPGTIANVGVLWAATAGVCYGVFLTMSRWLSDQGTPMALTISQLVISAFLLLPWGLWHLPEFTPTVAALAATSAVCSMLGNLLLLYAYRLAPATQLAPLVYFQLIAAVALGWLIFGTLPDTLTWLGLGLIIVAGVASARLR